MPLCLPCQLDPSFSCAFNRGSIFAESGDHESAVLGTSNLRRIYIMLCCICFAYVHHFIFVFYFEIRLLSMFMSDFNRITDGKLDGELRNRTVYYRAVSFVHLKRYDDAKFDLRSILLKEPNALAPRSLLAKAYKHTGHYQQSEECLNQCITKDCDQADLFIERSYIRCRLGSDHNIKEAYKGQYDSALCIVLFMPIIGGFEVFYFLLRITLPAATFINRSEQGNGNISPRVRQ